jgi:hypothetical protein
MLAADRWHILDDQRRHNSGAHCQYMEGLADYATRFLWGHPVGSNPTGDDCIHHHVAGRYEPWLIYYIT